ncbi:hypothetical protein BJ165DRAFT_1479879 [Panaeolus papilionaceus]|nr:hypothetical protein BJ165DRAFT_1479879 [Panaeolus papilionaceus]
MITARPDVHSEENLPIYLRLPLDIFMLIFENFVENPAYGFAQRQRDLCACSLVCRAFVPICQRLIFAEVPIGHSRNRNIYRARNRLSMALQQNSKFTTYIRRLFYLSSGYQAESAPSLSLLLHLPRVHQLDISSGADYYQVPFGSTSQKPFGLEHFFREYISSGLLTTLSIDGVRNLPIHDVLSPTNLASLRLVRCSLISNPARSPKVLKLRHLDLEHVTGFSLSLVRNCRALETLFLQQTARTQLPAMMKHYQDYF